MNQPIEDLAASLRLVCKLAEDLNQERLQAQNEALNDSPSRRNDPLVVNAPDGAFAHERRKKALKMISDVIEKAEKAGHLNAICHVTIKTAQSPNGFLYVIKAILDTHAHL